MDESLGKYKKLLEPYKSIIFLGVVRDVDLNPDGHFLGSSCSIANFLGSI